MNDRELLELAAKAIGRKPHASQCDMPGILLDDMTLWSPLDDDGDALRLAVRLGLDVFCRPAQWSECGRIGTSGCRELHGSDRFAATRRAIVRAAAEIGRNMP